ncbi:MAG: PIG-L deacetylase family protein [Candidatus Hermodarchaeota archaeon]
MNDNNVIIILAPHTDDGELGMGGTIVKYLELGKKIYYIAFSAPREILKEELRNATKMLGIPQEQVILYDFPVRKFSYNRQDILEELVKIRKDLQPDMVFLPSSHDLHQDHKTISEEGIRAFKRDSLLAYELPWNNIVFQTQCFSVLEERHIKKKIDALFCYNSQKHRNYLNEEFIRGLAIARGVQIQEKYAEVFEVIRWKI